MPSDDRTTRYTDDEARAILHRAIERSQPVDGPSHDDLVQAARELGIDPALVDEAAAQVRSESDFARWSSRCGAAATELLGVTRARSCW